MSWTLDRAFACSSFWSGRYTFIIALIGVEPIRNYIYQAARNKTFSSHPFELREGVYYLAPIIRRLASDLKILKELRVEFNRMLIVTDTVTNLRRQTV